MTLDQFLTQCETTVETHRKTDGTLPGEQAAREAVKLLATANKMLRELTTTVHSIGTIETGPVGRWRYQANREVAERILKENEL